MLKCGNLANLMFISPSNFLVGRTNENKMLNILPSKHRRYVCIAFIQCWPNIEDIVPTLYRCYTNVLCLLGRPIDKISSLSVNTCVAEWFVSIFSSFDAGIADAISSCKWPKNALNQIIWWLPISIHEQSYLFHWHFLFGLKLSWNNIHLTYIYDF